MSDDNKKKERPNVLGEGVAGPELLTQLLSNASDTAVETLADKVCEVVDVFSGIHNISPREVISDLQDSVRNPIVCVGNFHIEGVNFDVHMNISVQPKESEELDDDDDEDEDLDTSDPNVN